jgi:hypothetical protein
LVAAQGLGNPSLARRIRSKKAKVAIALKMAPFERNRHHPPKKMSGGSYIGQKTDENL